MVEETKDEEMKEEEIKEEEKVKEDASGAEPDKEEKPLDKMTVIELRAIAREIPGVTGTTAMKKDQLLSIIKEYRGIEEEEPKKKKFVSDDGVTVKDLKKKIVMLRADKDAACNEKDKKKVNILRRRINRLKKRTRMVGRA
jgi:hypothetical protein